MAKEQKEDYSLIELINKATLIVRESNNPNTAETKKKGLEKELKKLLIEGFTFLFTEAIKDDK